jgi:hypothetical protein
MRIWLASSLALGLVLTSAGASCAQDQAEINALIDRAIKAMGGPEKVATLQASSWKGKADHQVGDKTAQLLYEGSVQAWDKYRVDAEISAGRQSRKLLIILNGGKGWQKENDGPAVKVPSELLAFSKHALYAIRTSQWLSGLKNKAFQIAPLGEARIGDKQAVGIRITHKDHQDLNLYFDKASGLPLKSEARLTLPGGQETTVEYYFSDYKDFDGIRHFSRITIRADGKEITTELTGIRPQENFDASVFSKP